jgi:hypothetical protein
MPKAKDEGGNRKGKPSSPDGWKRVKSYEEDETEKKMGD